MSLAKANRPASISRRSFLRTASAAACAAAASGIAVPFLAPASTLGREGSVAPSDRIGVGWIGTGHRGTAVMHEFLAQKDVRVLAVSDVKSRVLGAARDLIDARQGGTGCAAYPDYRELLERKDIDLVLSATTDHWHVLTAIHAAEAGKDIYLEKPMGLNLEECLALQEAVHRNRRVFQFGTQQRSDPKFLLACELARNERIGRLKTIHVWSPGSSRGGPTNPVPPPRDLDYDRWLGPAPWKPYTPDRASNAWWWFISDYALGFIAGWGIHPIDIAVWGGGERLSGPIEAEGQGEFPTEGVCDTATNWRIALRFASGVTLSFAGDPRPEEWTRRYPGSESHGTAFEGTEGWVHVNRAVINSEPQSLVGSTIGADGVRLTRTNGHVRNLLDCVRSRAETVSSIDESIRSETLCQVSEIAIRLGRKVTWDPATRTFPGDDEANRRLSRPMRAPWSLPRRGV